MAEKHRIRGKQIHVKLLEEEMEMLIEKAEKSGLSKSEYVRMLIAYGGIRGDGKTNYTREDAKKLRYEITSIGNNVNQIAYRVNLNTTAKKEDVENLREEFKNLLELFHRYVTE
jgi:hypothetical protein